MTRQIQKRRRIAVSGITTLEVFVIVILVAIAGAILFPVFACRGESAAKAMCLSNLKQLGISTIIYAADHNERLPHRDSWMDGIKEYTRNESSFYCPGVRNEENPNPKLYGYAFHSRLSNADQLKIEEPEKVPMIYDSVNFARNASDPFTGLPNPPRKHGNSAVNIVAYLDMHVKPLRNKEQSVAKP